LYYFVRLFTKLYAFLKCILITDILSGDWMSIPTGIPNCPRGLEYLTTIDQLLVKQKVELLEAFTGFETNNKFTIKNAL